ncbi:hypothetical protein CCP2SC5_230022 [Azospirillaceae bacterium]
MFKNDAQQLIEALAATSQQPIAPCDAKTAHAPLTNSTQALPSKPVYKKDP